MGGYGSGQEIVRVSEQTWPGMRATKSKLGYSECIYFDSINAVMYRIDIRQLKWSGYSRRGAFHTGLKRSSRLVPDLNSTLR